MQGKDQIQAIQIQGVTAKDLIKAFKQEIKDLFPKNQNQTSSEKLLTRSETAKLLHVSLVTLHNWTKEGILTAYRIGNQVRYKESEVIQALSEIPTRKK